MDNLLEELAPMLGDRVNNGRFAFAFLTALTPLAMMAAAAAPMVLTAPALGDVQSVTPYYAVVTVDKAPAHCGSNDRFYRVGELTNGQVVMVDGEGDNWSRISYPSSLIAFVRVEDVKIDGGLATLTTASKLKAANAASGYGGSWKALMDSPLPTGTTLKVIEPAKEGDVVVGYKIAAPEMARAFVESRSLRHASDAEVEAFKAKGPVPAIPSKTTTPEVKPDANGVKPVTPGNTTDTTKTTTPSGTTPGPVVINQPETKTTVPPAPAKPEDRMVGTFDRLEETFQTVWKQPVLTSEVGELQAEYERAVEKAAGRPELQKQLQARVDALKLRVDFREKLRKQEEGREALNKTKNQLEEEVAAWEKSRVYTIVGELQPSTVYDGKRLPLMYRVVSVGGSPRTLGYLKESKDTDLTKMIGQVIGVIGESTLDRSLKLNIIDPVKVVTLKEVQPANEVKEAPSAGVEEKGEQTPGK
jgi:hypothetical protein